jgi:hypothetical protein
MDCHYTYIQNMNSTIYIVKDNISNDIDDIGFDYEKSESYLYTQSGIYKKINDEFYKVNIDNTFVKEVTYNNEDIKFYLDKEEVNMNEKLQRIPYHHFHVETLIETCAFQNNLMVTRITENDQYVSYRFVVTDTNDMEDMNDEKMLYCIRKITEFLGKL